MGRLMVRTRYVVMADTYDEALSMAKERRKQRFPQFADGTWSGADLLDGIADITII